MKKRKVTSTLTRTGEGEGVVRRGRIADGGWRAGEDAGIRAGEVSVGRAEMELILFSLLLFLIENIIHYNSSPG